MDGAGRVVGIVVLDVVDDGPAAEAGVRSGDVIVGLAEEEVRSIRDFLSALHRLDVGAEVALEVLRGGERVELQVTIGERPASA